MPTIVSSIEYKRKTQNASLSLQLCTVNIRDTHECTQQSMLGLHVMQLNFFELYIN